MAFIHKSLVKGLRSTKQLFARKADVVQPVKAVKKKRSLRWLFATTKTQSPVITLAIASDQIEKRDAFSKSLFSGFFKQSNNIADWDIITPAPIAATKAMEQSTVCGIEVIVETEKHEATTCTLETRERIIGDPAFANLPFHPTHCADLRKLNAEDSDAIFEARFVDFRSLRKPLTQTPQRFDILDPVDLRRKATIKFYIDSRQTFIASQFQLLPPAERAAAEKRHQEAFEKAGQAERTTQLA